MAKTTITLPADGTDVVTYTDGSGDHQQAVVLVYGDGTAWPGDGTSGAKMQLGAALPAGTNNIGDVDVVSLPALAAGTNAIGKLTANSGVDIGDVDVTSVIPGTAATDLGKAEDGADGGTDTGVKMLATRDDTLATLTPADGDYTGLRVDDEGKLWTRAIIPDADGNALVFAAPVVASVTPTLDTSAYADGDSMDTTVLSFTGAANDSGSSGHVLRMTVIDDDDQGVDMKLHLFDASVTPATENTAHSLSDADADGYIGTISTSDGTWQDHTLNQTVTVVPAPPIPYKLASGTTLYGVLVSEGTGTYTASGLEIKLHLLLD